MSSFEIIRESIKHPPETPDGYPMRRPDAVDKDFVTDGEPLEWATIIRDVVVDNYGAGSNQDNPFGYTYDGRTYVTKKPMAVLEPEDPLYVYGFSTQRQMGSPWQYSGLYVGVSTAEDASQNPCLFTAFDLKLASKPGQIDVAMSPLLSTPEDETAPWQLVVGEVMKSVIENIRAERTV